ncbi:hypothetical protein KDA14_01715 [Candidatus Saccharibacteria bacterium]|nr:hypothetical protein [Candidatus Saccharibacteria bacterium]
MSYDPGASGISGAPDVAFGTKSDGQVVKYDQGIDKWRNLGLAKADVGLGNVDNTSDANKPISTAGQTAIDDLQAGLNDAILVGEPLSSFSGSVDYDQLAPYTVVALFYNTGSSTWPARPSARTDLVFAWCGPATDPPTVGGSGMVDGVDKFWAEY